ncbi:KTSC domain-containing protein [Microbacterium schleiferi]|uniref:KTSC domain-containing protein n=1 Tax=Microbacterium schleiferi TaxID=69362 RepID=A0A7S8MZN1_9MICO|nr:KTSC domain-containing protein [Microbacterium schleiferi]
MNREPVTSSNLSSVGYDESSQTLEVEFKNGNIYQYFDVPSSEHIELMRSDSVGTYFSANIRTAYRYTRL